MRNEIRPAQERRRDLPGMIAAGLFILVGLWVIWQSLTMSDLGAVFPRTIAVALIAFSVALLIANLRAGRGTRAPEDRVYAGRPESTPRRLALVGILVAWVLLLPVIGFLVTSAFAFLGILAVANYDGWTTRRTIVYVVSVAAIVGGFYLLLVEVLLLPMPRGLLF